jgi:hypothetical protein
MAYSLKKVVDTEIDKIAGLSNFLGHLNQGGLDYNAERILMVSENIMKLIPTKNWFVVPTVKDTWNIHGDYDGQDTYLELYEFV